MTPRRTLFRLALVLAFGSGAAGLAHQIVWTRRMVDVLGANADTFSKVVGAFFVGLALGAWLASCSKNSTANYWRRVALAEGAVALLAVPALVSSHYADCTYQNAALGNWLKLLLPLLFVTPAATAMGLVIPWMIRALAANESCLPRHSTWLYGVNTLGGVMGIGGALLLALPAWGLFGASLGVIGLNLIVAIGAFVLSAQDSRTDAAQFNARTIDAKAETETLLTSAAIRNAFAFASGFLVLAAEVVLQKQIAQVAINSLFSSAAVLAMVLISLGLAALFTPLLVSRAGNYQRALGLALVVAALLCATQPFLLTQMRDGVNILPYELPPLAYLWEIFKLGGIAICPMLLASGFVFPLLLRTAVGENSRDAGLLLAWNGLGGWMGAELAELLLLPQFGLWRSMALLGGGYAVLFAIYDLRFTIRASQVGAIINRQSRIRSAVPVLLLVVVMGWFVGGLPQATINHAERLVALNVGREGVVATVECGADDWRILFNNSYTLGGSKAQFNQERQGLLPLLLHGNPKSVGVLGVATGGTTAGMALHSGVERVDAIELSPLVLRQAKEFFGPFNRTVFTDSRVHFLLEDARWVIAYRRAEYDVVVGDLFLPWRTGEGRLFTREHFQNVRASLKPDGLFCQWLPLFQLTRAQFDAIARTFREVFPDVFIVRGDFYCELPIVGIVGGRDLAALDWTRIEFGCAKIRSEGKSADPLVRHVDGVAMMMLGPLPDPGAGPLNTLENAWLEWNAGQNILGLREPWFVGIPAAEYVRDIQRAGIAMLPERFRAAQEAGQFFLTLEVAAKLELPARAEMENQIPNRVPAAMWADREADWRQWPMRVKPKNVVIKTRLEMDALSSQP